MFGFAAGTTGFGQPAQQAAPTFGAQPASPFGAAFGQPTQAAASPFGATASSAPLFGAQSPAPAFGQAAPAAAPAFGATTNTTGFGTAAFGAAAKPAGFGGFGTTTTAAPNPFGATAQSAPAFGGFGAASAPAFGAPAAAPANPFGATTSGFGATAAPAFGAAPAATGFGAPAAPTAAPFGTTTTNLFGAPAASPSPFGAAPTQPAGGFGGFGAAPTGVSTNGTRNVPYNKTKDPDVPAGQPATFLMSISALPNFQQPAPAKSHEELRWEDYQEGVKNQSAGPAPQAAGAFGAPAAAPGAFGGFGAATQPATAFGAATAANPFGAPASAPAFGATAAPAFGAAATTTQPSLFGTTPAPAANPFGAPAASAPAFGGFGSAAPAASQPSLFGNNPATGFGSSAFGPSTPGFGAASSAATFSFSSSPSTFGAASAPATSLFGTAPAAASSPFGAPPSTIGAAASPFGAASSASAFGTSTFGAFGATAAKPASPFGAPTATTPFGTTAPAAGGTSLFGTSPFNFNSQPASSPSIFGNTAGGSTMSFTSNLFNPPAAAPATGGLFGAAAAAPAAAAQPPSVAQPAYGSFGSLPAVPDAKVGITTRGVRNASISSGASKASPLLSLRSTPARYGASVRPRHDQLPPSFGLGPVSAAPPAMGISGLLPAAGGIASTGSDLLTPAPGGGAGGSIAAVAAAAVAVGGTGLLPPRQNPHRLFIAAPPPSTDAAGGGSFLTPARPASAYRAATPDGVAGSGAADDGGHGDGAAAETPAAHRQGGGVNGYANGFSGGSGAAAGAAVRGSAAAAAPATTTFQDPSAAEPYLPRLGHLAAEGFTFSPNPDELRLLHSQNPDNLASVSNFTVTRPDVGQVRWVVPVDVRGLALYDIVSMQYGEVCCYPDASVKPPQGQGLNKPAEITLYGVYKKDKATGALIKDGPRGQAYEKVLRQMCAKMGAKFISYKLDGGIWKFEVEHFSRYGLLDDDEEEDAGAAAAAAAAAPVAGRGTRAARVPEEGVGEAPGVAAAGVQPLGHHRRLGQGQDAEAEDGSQQQLAGRGLVGAGLRVFGFSGAGRPAASAAGRAPAPLLPEDSEMEPSVGIRRQQFGLQPEAGGSETTGLAAGGADQDMSEARAQLRFGDDPAVEAEVSGGVVGPAAPLLREGSTVTGSMGMQPPLDLEPQDGGGGGRHTVPIQHALPAGLAHDPFQTRALHEAFFGGGGGGGGGDGSRRASIAGGSFGTAGAAGMAQSFGFRQQQQALFSTAGGAGGRAEAGGGGVGGARSRPAAAAGMAGQTGPVKTIWRHPTASLSTGAPAAVVARGAALLSSSGAGAGDDAGPGGDVSPLPITLALARPVDQIHPSVAMVDVSEQAVRPLRDLRTAGCLTDAGLAMGRSFRVGWGPGGKLVVPGAAEAASATEICVTRVRVEGESSAYGESSYYSGGDAGAENEEVERLEALRERLRAALEVHLAASKPVLPSGSNDSDSDDLHGSRPLVPYWRLCVDSRELPVLVERYVRVCEAQLQQLLGGGGGGAGGATAGDAGARAAMGAAGDADADNPDVLRLRHEVDTWRLLEVLFAKIGGEVPEGVERDGAAATPAAAAGGGGGGGGGDDMMVLSTPPGQQSHRDDGDDGMAGEPAGGGGSQSGTPPRTQLAALQRRAQLALWLQRQARRRVEEDLRSVESPATVVLQLLAAHQLAASAGAAMAAGDPRLAMLIARAGSRSSVRAQLAAQLEIWQRSGFSEHMAPERLAAYHLLAGQVLQTQRLLSLDWRRLLGLYLWYGTPNTSSPMSAVQRYVMDRHTEPALVPHPAPYHVEGLLPSATGAVPGSAAVATCSSDVQWELLHLWATTPAAATADCIAAGQLATPAGVAAAAERARAGWLAGGGCSRLLRCSGYSSNPLDHSLAWHLMTLLQAIDVLPGIGDTAAGPSHQRSLSDRSGSPSPPSLDMLGTCLEFISQLLLAGGLCEWALYVALTIPDLREQGSGSSADAGAASGGSEEAAGGGGGAAVRERVVRELLTMTAPEWMGDSAREAFLTSTLRLPEELLAEARATWAQYTRDDKARCAALLAAGDAAAAHDIFTAAVAPSLFLSGEWAELSQLIEGLEPRASALAAWDIGGGLYGNFLAIFGRQLVSAAAAATAASGSGAAGFFSSAVTALPEGVSLQEFLSLVEQVQRAQLVEEKAAAQQQQQQQAAEAILSGGARPGGGASLLLSSSASQDPSSWMRRLVLGRMASKVLAASTMSGVAGGGGAGHATGLEGRRAVLQSGLAVPWCGQSELQLGGMAVAVAEAGANVVGTA